MESAYAATLPARERRLAGRLEGFGDIVFGFAVSQCAIQLPTTGGYTDISHIGSLLGYFATFAILASLWLTYHGIMSGSFKPTRLDVFFAFAYLALVTLMPYALYATRHRVATLESATAAVAIYASLFAVLLFIAALVTFRNLRRGWPLLDEEERGFTWRALLRRIGLGLVLALACAVDLRIGPAQSTFVFLTLPLVPPVLRLLFKKPSPRFLRLPEEAAIPA